MLEQPALTVRAGCASMGPVHKGALGPSNNTGVSCIQAGHHTTSDAAKVVNSHQPKAI